jgi:hypothetical protein
MKTFLLGSIFLLLIMTACQFTGAEILRETTPTAQMTPTIEVSPTDVSTSECRELLPNETNPAIKDWNEPHIVCSPADDNPLGKLFVYFPGTGATPDYYTYLSNTAAESGLHVINLRYPNDRSVNLQICPRDNDNACNEKVRQEIAQGVDVSPNVEVDMENSIEGRLLSVLTYLSETYPDEGWSQYLTDGTVRWDSVITAGHSQGGGHAVYIAYQHHVDRAISFAWADVRRGEMAGWLTDNVSQTPPDSYYLFYHEQDDRVAKFQPQLIEALGLESFGEPVIVDGNRAPFENSHALVATYPAPQGERAHNTHVVDQALIFDDNGAPIYEPVWQFLLTLDPSVNGEINGPQTSQNSINAFKIGSSSLGYFDPEFYSERNLVTYVDTNMDAWLATLDPQTGDFISADGRDILVDEAVTPLRISFNAPEFGVDNNGWALYYTKDVDGVPQVFRAEVEGTTVTTTALTSDNTMRLSAQPSKNPEFDATRIFYAHEGFEGNLGWIHENDVQNETIVEFMDRGTRWINGTSLFTFVIDGQVAIYDTETSTYQTVTDTPGQKSFSYGWLAPETGGLLLLTIVDESRIEIYADNGSAYWGKIAILNIPQESAYDIIGSPEPFVAGGKSYISLVIKESNGYAPAEVWVWGIENGPEQYQFQCQDGEANVIRTDPEFYIGAEQIFVYYNLIPLYQGNQVFQLYRCETGITP